MSTIGFVGLGAMGSRIASRLLDAGNDVYGTNRTKSRAQPLIEHGLRWRDTPREVAAVVDVIFSMVTNDHALEAVHGWGKARGCVVTRRNSKIMGQVVYHASGRDRRRSSRAS